MDKWKKITGYDYEVSINGEVRNKTTGKILSPWRTGSGLRYLGVYLCNNGLRKKFRVHRLVAKAFVSNTAPRTKTEVNHLDGNPHNNHAKNLEWCTHDENQAHARGLHIARSRARKAVKYTQGNLRKVIVRQNGKRDIQGFFHRFTTGNRPKAIVELKHDGSIITTAATSLVFL